jgi:hypothetical protein
LKLTKQTTLMQVRPDGSDTFVIGYPKSGTTWTSEIVWLIKNRLDFKKAKRLSYKHRYSYIADRYSPLLVNFQSSPRVFRSHVLLKHLPKDIAHKAKIIYIVRNPKDVIVSSYFYIKSSRVRHANGKAKKNTLNGVLNEFVSGDLWKEWGDYGSWWQNVNEYTRLKDTICIIHYEDLVQVKRAYMLCDVNTIFCFNCVTIYNLKESNQNPGHNSRISWRSFDSWRAQIDC